MRWVGGGDEGKAEKEGKKGNYEKVGRYEMGREGGKVRWKSKMGRSGD
jgi:hypothetical protein